MAIELPELPYGRDALAPHISEEYATTNSRRVGTRLLRRLP